jgi:ABC-type polysaccharide/polyol phosphate transport system ATPase subunit
MLTQINLQNVGLDFKIYGTNERSFKKKIATSMGIGKLQYLSDSSVKISALKNISFKLSHGDRLGLLGFNGSGKSTLLRVVAGVYHPTEGSLKVDGNVTSIIEPALGLDPFLTGYENINSRLMLLTGGKCVMDDEIINNIENISKLGEFLNFPVHSYSSGMIMRLNFAISIAIKPEILILDEWLSVTDKNFKSYAETEMNKFINQASIMVIASHDVALLQNTCNIGLVLRDGEMLFYGHIKDAIKEYLSL